MLPPLVDISKELANHTGQLLWLNNNPIMNKKNAAVQPAASGEGAGEAAGSRARVPLGGAAGGEKGSRDAYVRGTLSLKQSFWLGESQQLKFLGRCFTWRPVTNIC